MQVDCCTVGDPLQWPVLEERGEGAQFETLTRCCTWHEQPKMHGYKEARRLYGDNEEEQYLHVRLDRVRGCECREVASCLALAQDEPKVGGRRNPMCADGSARIQQSSECFSLKSSINRDWSMKMMTSSRRWDSQSMARSSAHTSPSAIVCGGVSRVCSQ